MTYAAMDLKGGDQIRVDGLDVVVVTRTAPVGRNGFKIEYRDCRGQIGALLFDAEQRIEIAYDDEEPTDAEWDEVWEDEGV